LKPRPVKGLRRAAALQNRAGHCPLVHIGAGGNGNIRFVSTLPSTCHPGGKIMAARKTTAAVAWTWSAIFTGVIASLVVQILLTMLGLGVGLLSISAATASSAPFGVSWAAFLWWVASGVFASFVGGVFAAMHSPSQSENMRIGHAVASWAVATVLIVAAAGLTAGGAATMAGNLVGPTSTTAANIQALSRPAAGGAVNQAQLEQARKQFGVAMFASFFALLLGAGAAYLGGASEDDLEDWLKGR
jgi:hypothetical protein